MGRIGVAAVLGFFLLAGCASTRPPTSEDVVTIALRHGYPICAGSCADVDITVRPDGRVLVAQRLYTPVRMRRFWVSPAKTARFREILSPYRPLVAQPEDVICGRDATDPLVIEVTEIAITWEGEDTVRLTGCTTPENAALIDTIIEALRPVDLYITGHRPSDSRRRNFWWRASFGLLYSS